MNALKIVTAAVLLSGCSTPEERDRVAVMNHIERQVQLPKGSRSLVEYARYYAESDRGEVVAVYLIPDNYEMRAGESCSEALADFKSREVPCETLLMRSDWDIPAGERRWVRSEQDLPLVSDGGCSVITVTFDKAKSVMKSAECNGLA